MDTFFGILGDLRVIQGGEPVDLGSPRQRVLLARLLTARAAVSTDRLLEDLWPEDEPESARHTMHVYVSRLRKALGDDGARLQRAGLGYRLLVAADELDAARFERLAGEGRAARARGDLQVAEARLGEALDLWRGPALGEFQDEAFARDEASRLDDLRLTALEDRYWTILERGQGPGLVDELEPLVREHPFREAFAEQLMIALYRSGRQADALRVYQSVRDRLADELGIDPGPALRDAEQRILRQDPSLGGPASAGRGAGRRLPVQRTSFVGRDVELRRGAELLGGTRLLTLTGAPGTGKTRLALRLATDNASGYADGAYFVPLATVSDARFVTSAIVAALDLRETGDESLLDTAKAFLRDREVLLVLDNFEHVADAAEEIGDLLDAAPGLTVLATSRARLGLAGEQEFPVPPLGLPSADGTASLESLRASDAVALLLARARAVDPDFDLTPENAEAVAGITARVDGLPLAIELASARVRLLDPQELLGRLGRRLGMLTGGPADSEDRHRTMRACVAWSYELLPAEEQEVFRRLGVFQGSFTLDAAAAITALPDEDTVRTVDSLLSKSLLVRPVDVGAARYAMLETIREYATDELASADESAETADRHAQYFRRVACEIEPKLTGEDPGSAADLLGRDVDNLRRATQHAVDTGDAEIGLELASSIWRFWQSSGQLAEGRYWLERVLAIDGASNMAAAKGRTALAGLAYWQGDFESSVESYRRAAALYRAAGDQSGEADALYGQSLAASLSGDLDAAEQLAGKAREIFEGLGADEEVGQVLMAQGTAAWKKGDLARARELWEAALEISTRLEDQSLAASQMVGLAGIAFQQDEPSEAREHVSKALEMAVETGNAHIQVFALDAVASFTFDLDPAGAVRLSSAAAVLRESHGGGWTLDAMGIKNARDAVAGRLSAGEAERAWAEGSTLGLEESTDVARLLLAEAAARSR